MKPVKLTLIAMLFLTVAACNKENNNVFQQSHSQNRMMALMHTMMDSMNSMSMTNDPDIDFSMMMKMHHEGAISMAQLEKSEGVDGTLKPLAQNIIDAQTQEIQELNAYLSSHMAPDNLDMDFSNKMMDRMDETGRQADLQIINGKIDEDFATLMILHHQSAVDMAHHYLLKGNEAQLKTMAENIVTTQTNEIKTLQNWLLPLRKK